MAWNVALLRRFVTPECAWLDVGSFGVEPLLVRASAPPRALAAVAFEQNHVGLGGTKEPGFFESDRPDARSLAILGIDLERDRLPFADASFDLVTCFEVIEHLKLTPLVMLDEIRRVLKPSGAVLLTTPNLAGSRSVAKALAGVHPQEMPRYHGDARYGIVHPKEYVAYELRDLLMARGFTIRSLTTRTFRRVSPVERMLRAALWALRKTVALRLERVRGDVHLGDNFVCVLARAEAVAAGLPASVFETQGIYPLRPPSTPATASSSSPGSPAPHDM